MILIIFIAFFSLIFLLVIHEFGHFILAKKFGVRVDEFGIGYPPRIFGKKIGETIYSLNLLPFGAFVKIYGEEGGIEDYQSFSQKPLWQRAAIILGGVVSFWIFAMIVLSIVMGLGAPTAIGDQEAGNLRDLKVQIAALAPGSPAETAGIKLGDAIKGLRIGEEKWEIEKVSQVQEFTSLHRGKEITLTIERGSQRFDVKLVPRVLPPEGEGAMGVILIRTAIKSYPWHMAFYQGISQTINLTIAIVQGLSMALFNALRGLPSGTQLVGPVGIVAIFSQVGQLGANYFLHFVAVVSIHLALFNLLPIPVADGGKLLFLGIEAIRKKPVSPKIEQKITSFSFALLIILAIWVTIKDIGRLF